MTIKNRWLVPVAGAFAAAAMASSATAADMPKSMTWTAYGTTSSGYAQVVAIGNMLKNRYGVSVRPLPGKNDVSRMGPLKSGRAQFCACGIAAYYGQEGVFLFAKKNWGPQPLRILMNSVGTFGLMVAVAGDVKANSWAEMKGKRVVMVRGAPALNNNALSFLAFGGLSWKDVKQVPVSGFAAGFNAIINGQADAAFTSTVSPVTKKLAASPRGLKWLPLNPNDNEGWARLNKVAPYTLKARVNIGTNIARDKPMDGANYPYPILVTNATTKAGTVQAIVNAMIKHFDDYKKGAPGASGWALSNQKFQWVIPYHDGAIAAFKAAGKWTDADQAHNDKLVKRQEVLAAAWKAHLATNPDGGDGFAKGWMAARAKALSAAGMAVVYK